MPKTRPHKIRSSDTKTRINAKIRRFLEHLIYDRRTVQESAQLVGWTYDWAYRLMLRSDVNRLRREMAKQVLSASGARALRKVEEIMDTAKSPAVQLDAAQYLIDVNGEGPVQRQHIVHEDARQQPRGLTIIFQQRPEQPATPGDDAKRINRVGEFQPLPWAARSPVLDGSGKPLPTPRPHPALAHLQEDEP